MHSRKRIKSILLIISALLTIKCSNVIERNKVVSINEFNEQISIISKSCHEIRNDIYPMFMGIKDSLLVLCDVKSDPHVYVYRLPDLEYLGHFGSQGKGPADLQDPVFWGQFEVNQGSPKAWFYQTNAMRYSLIDIYNAITENGNNCLDKEIVLPPHIGSAVNLISLDEVKIIASGRVSQGEFMIYNLTTKKTEWQPFLVDFNKQFMESIKKLNMLNSYKQGIIKSKPDGTHFVKVFGYVPVIDVYNDEAELCFSIIKDGYKKPTINKNKRQFEPDTRVYYTNVFLSDTYIYALNQNCNLQELSDGNSKDVEIDIFSWKGEPLYKIKLNEGIGALAPFAVDEINKSIYTVNPKSPDDYFSVFDISQLVY